MQHNLNNKNASINANTPGERLKYIRNLINVSRAYINDKYGLSSDTLAAWENGKINVTEKGVNRCIKAYRAEGLIVSKEWILTGEGLDPKFSLDLNRYFKTLPSENTNEKPDDKLLIIREIEFFQSLSANSVALVVSNDDMLPLYANGDYVGGRFKFGSEIDNCISKDCIVKTEDGGTYIRRVAKNPNGKGYNLVAINPQYNGSAEPVLFNVEVKCAAPIIWHRRNDSEN